MIRLFEGFTVFLLAWFKRMNESVLIQIEQRNAERIESKVEAMSKFGKLARIGTGTHQLSNEHPITLELALQVK